MKCFLDKNRVWEYVNDMMYRTGKTWLNFSLNHTLQHCVYWGFSLGGTETDELEGYVQRQAQNETERLQPFNVLERKRESRRI